MATKITIWIVEMTNSFLQCSTGRKEQWLISTGRKGQWLIRTGRKGQWLIRTG